MFAEQRHRAILTEVSEHSRVSVKALAERLSVADETIRRDLDRLADDGLVVRVHGGAIARRSAVAEPDLSTRLTTNSDAKALIAQAAARFIPSAGGSVLIDAGSSTAALVPALAASGATLLTHSPGIAQDAVAAGAHDLHVLPGKLRPTTRAAVGAATLAALGTLSPSVAFLGCNGVSAEGFVTPDPEEAAVKREIVRRAGLRIMLADATKFHAPGLVTFAEFADIDVLVTNSPLPADLAEAADRATIEVLLP